MTSRLIQDSESSALLVFCLLYVEFKFKFMAVFSQNKVKKFLNSLILSVKEIVLISWISFYC